MAGMTDADLNERGVSGDVPVVTSTQAELQRRCISARGTKRAIRVEDRRADQERCARLRDRLAEIRSTRIIVDQYRRIRLPPLVVPGSRPLQGEPGQDAGDQRCLDTLNEKVLPVGVEEDVAGHTGVEEGDLDVVPGLPIHRTVPLQAMVKKLRLPADFIVGQIVGMVRAGQYQLRLKIVCWVQGLQRPAILVEAAGPEPLGER